MVTKPDIGQTSWGPTLNGALDALQASIDGNASSISANGSSISTLQGQMSTANGNISALQSSDSTQSTNITALQGLTDTIDWKPSDHGLLGWTQDPAGCSTVATLSAGTIYLSKVVLRKAATVSSIWIALTSAGSGLTAGQNLAGLYDSSGNRLAVSADQSSSWTTASSKQISIAPQSLAAGSYYVAVLANGTTVPQTMRGGSASGTGLNVALALTAARFLDFGTGQTSLPSTITLSSASLNSSARWAAIS